MYRAIGNALNLNLLLFLLYLYFGSLFFDWKIHNVQYLLGYFNFVDMQAFKMNSIKKVSLKIFKGDFVCL